ncbi:MAG: hypothetical protein AAB225_27495 [Acidobacteriota bacterium]
MRRRQFLAGASGAGVVLGQGRGPTDKTVTVQVAGTRHPRVLAGASALTQQLRKLGIDANFEGEGAIRVVAAVANGKSRSALANAGWAGRVPPGAEEYEITARPEGVVAVSGGERGLVYALAELRQAAAERGSLPESLAVRRKPVFPVRRWSTAVSHVFGSPWDERIHLAQRFQFIRSEILPRAADYGMNSIELNGRPGDGWDIAWIIGFEKYPELARLYREGERRQRLALVEDLARAAHDNLLDFLVWNHELYLPPGFIDLYPQAKGTGYPVCLSNAFLKQFIRDKYVEFFEGAPSVDGVVMSVNESGQFSLLTDAGCKCQRCSRLTQHQRLMAVLDEVVAVCGRLSKQVVLRTFQGSFTHALDSHPELETIRQAYDGLPPQVQVMSKYCPLDFYGGVIADEPLIGAFPNRHLVEFSLDVEWQGRTFVPVLTPENFQRRVRFAIGKQCAGVVGRVDFPFPSMEPEPIFGHPNEYNAVYFSELCWDPDTDIDRSLSRWTKSRYGAEAAPALARALRLSEAITQKTFFAQGQTLLNYHNMIGSVSNADNNLWGHALSKWDASKRELSQSFFDPPDDLIARCRREKQDAVALANEGLRLIQEARPRLALRDFQRLRYDFEKLRDTAELWQDLTELYLLHRQIAYSPPKPGRIEKALGGDARLPRLVGAASSALRHAVAMELRHGRNSWPVVSPDRGVSAHQFVHEVLRHYIGGVTGEPVGSQVRARYVDNVTTAPVVAPDSTEGLWRQLVECGRPGFASGNAAEGALEWPVELRQVRLEGTVMALTGKRDATLELPLAFPARSSILKPGGRQTLRIRKTATQLVVEPVRSTATHSGGESWHIV